MVKTELKEKKRSSPTFEKPPKHWTHSRESPNDLPELSGLTEGAAPTVETASVQPLARSQHPAPAATSHPCPSDLPVYIPQPQPHLPPKNQAALVLELPERL